MKTILVPTDFAQDDPALQYAIELNKILQGEVVLFHSVLASNYEEEDSNLNRRNKTEAWRMEAIQELEKIKNNLISQNPGMQISITTANGWTSDQILVEEKNSKPDFIIMGKRNENLLCEFLISSNCSVIVEKSTSPVIVIPAGTKISSPGNIVYATNYEEDDYENIFSLIEFARNFQSNVNLVHVINDNSLKIPEHKKLKDLTDRLKKETNYQRIQFNLLMHHSIFKGLSDYIEKSNPDLIALSIRDRHLKLFGSSLTNKFSLRTNIPMMVFHTRASS